MRERIKFRRRIACWKLLQPQLRNTHIELRTYCPTCPSQRLFNPLNTKNNPSMQPNGELDGRFCSLSVYLRMHKQSMHALLASLLKNWWLVCAPQLFLPPPSSLLNACLPLFHQQVSHVEDECINLLSLVVHHHHGILIVEPRTSQGAWPLN